MWDNETFAVAALGACVTLGRLIERKEVALTREAYGPVMLLCCWAKEHAEPLYVVSNLSSAEEAIDYYTKRFHIEIFFPIRKVEGSICRSRIAQTRSVSHAY